MNEAIATVEQTVLYLNGKPMRVPAAGPEVEQAKLEATIRQCLQVLNQPIESIHSDEAVPLGPPEHMAIIRGALQKLANSWSFFPKEGQ